MLKIKLVLNFTVIGLLLAGSSAYAACIPNISNTLDTSITLSSSGTGDCVRNSAEIATIGNFVHGINSSGSSVTITNLNSIITEGYSAAGINSTGANALIYNIDSIATYGNTGYGIYSTGSSATITNLGEISTLGTESAGIYTLGDNAQIQNSGTIHTTANNAAGISSHGNNAIITNTGSIITLGDDSPSPHISADGIASYGDAATITNSGHITTSGPSAYGIYLIGNGVAVTNTGTISASGPDSHGLYSEASNASINNTGLISTTGQDSNGIYNKGIITSLQNLGTVKGAATSGGGNVGISNLNQIDTINNVGLIDLREAYKGIGLLNGGYGFSGTITSINNSGHIYGNFDTGTGIENSSNIASTITTLINSGDISGGSGVDNRGIIHNLVNSGTITGQTVGVYVGSSAEITTLTNLGSISVTSNSGDAIGLVNVNTITTLNNAQGGNGHTSATTELTYTGDLPTNYNIIIDSATHYGQLDGVIGTSGTTTFGIYTGSNVTSRLYSSVLLGVIGQVSNLTGTYADDNIDWTLVANGNNYDLRFTGINTAGTQASVHNSAQKLRSIFNTAAISTNFANMNTYDCNLFDTNGMCISAGGRYTTVDNPSANSSSAVVVVGYKATPNIRIGGFLDQNFNNTTPTGIRIANKNPMMGAFAVWNQKEDGLGLQVKVANAYQDKDVTTTRDGVTFTAESGTGATKLNTQSYVVEFSYAAKDQYDTLVRPYLALRYTNIKQDGYTETGISTPLTYDPLTDKSTSALFGVKFNRAITAKANITASLGLELDLEHSVDQYTATSAGISGLTSENFNNDIHRTRPVASLGAYYALTKTQRISGDVYYQQLPFQSTGSTTAYFNYMIGL